MVHQRALRSCRPRVQSLLRALCEPSLCRLIFHSWSEDLEPAGRDELNAVAKDSARKLLPRRHFDANSAEESEPLSRNAAVRRGPAQPQRSSGFAVSTRRARAEWLGNPVLYQLSYVRREVDSTRLDRPSHVVPYPLGRARAARRPRRALLVAATGACAAPAAKEADASVFGGLGTWTDIYDGRVYAQPEATAARIAARGVKTVWAETANYRASADVVQARAARPLRRGAARARRPGGRVVPAGPRQPWPRHPPGARDAQLPHGDRPVVRRDRAQHRGDEAPQRRPPLPARRRPDAPHPARSGRHAARDRPLQPARARARPTTWPRFPWAELAANADAFAPMIYTGGAYTGFDATYGYVTRAIRLLRTHTQNPDVAIHVAGGVADRLGAGGARRVRRGGRGRRQHDRRQPLRLGDDARLRLARSDAAQPLVDQASRSRSRVSSRCSGSTFTSASTGMKFVSPDQRGTTWTCTWSAMPAPATRPRFQPRLKPSGRRHG